MAVPSTIHGQQWDPCKADIEGGILLCIVSMTKVMGWKKMFDTIISLDQWWQQDFQSGELNGGQDRLGTNGLSAAQLI